MVVTLQDKKEADEKDRKIAAMFRDIDKKFDGSKNDLETWYLVGAEINRFIIKNNFDDWTWEDRENFWISLHGRSDTVGKFTPKNRIGRVRNNFLTASKLAKKPWSEVSKLGLSWTVWRDLLTYPVFRDERVFDWAVKNMPQATSEARRFFRDINARLKNIETSVCTDEQLMKKLADVKIRA